MPGHGPDALAEERADYDRVGLERRPDVVLFVNGPPPVPPITPPCLFGLLGRQTGLEGESANQGRSLRIFRWGETAVQLDAKGEFTTFNPLIRTV